MNWGGFGAGFSQGFGSGVQMGKTFNEAMKQSQLEQLQAKGIDEAKAQQKADINGMIKENGIGEQPKPADTSKAPIDSPNFVTIEQQQKMRAGTTPQPAEPAPVETQSVTPPSQGLSAPRPLDQAAQGITPQAQGQATPATSSPMTPATQTPTQIDPVRPDVATGSVAPASAAPGSITPGSITPAQPAPGTAAPSAAAPSAAPGMPPKPEPQMPFMVGTKGFKTREEAAKYAETQVGSLNDYFLKSVVPKRIEYHMAKGDIETATKLQDYMDSKRGKDATKAFGKAMTALMFTGDTENGVRLLGDYYSKYVDDGVDFVPDKTTIGKDGQINLTLKNKGDGKENAVTMSKTDLLRLGFAHDPAKLVEMGLTAAEAQRKEKAEITKEDRKFKNDVTLKGIEYGYKTKEKEADQRFQIEKLDIEKQLTAANMGAQEKAKIRARVDALRQAGKSEEFINDVMPGIIGIGDYKKKTSPEEARRLAHSDRMKSDPMYARKSAAEQKAILDKDMELIFGGVNPQTAPQLTPSAAPAGKNSAASSATTPAASTPQYVKDTQTGEIFKVEGGKRVPVDLPKPATKPAASATTTPSTTTPASPAASGLSPAPKAAASAAPKQTEAPADKAEAAPSEMEKIGSQIQTLNKTLAPLKSELQQVERDYAYASSLNGRRHVAPEVQQKIEARRDALRKQVAEMEGQVNALNSQSRTADMGKPKRADDLSKRYQ